MADNIPVKMFVDGCDYQGHEFGASYPDSVCLDGWLFDADSGYSIDGGWAYTSGGDIPCPKCNPKGKKPRLELDADMADKRDSEMPTEEALRMKALLKRETENG